MQEGQDDFITNRYRVDIQYRGTTGVAAQRDHLPRAVRIGRRPRTCATSPTRRRASRRCSLLNPANTYHWKATWGSEFRVVVRDGGDQRHRRIYNVGIASPKRQLRAEPALRVPRRAGRPQRHRGGLDSRHDLSQRLDRQPAAPDSLGSALR